MTIIGLQSKHLSAALGRLSVHQHGVVSRRQLRAHGITDPVVRRLVKLGVWTALPGCVRIVPADGDPLWQDAWAARLRLGNRAILSGRLAMRLGGLEVPMLNDADQLVLFPRSTGRRRHPVQRNAPRVRLLERWDGTGDPPGKLCRRGGVTMRAPVDALLDALATEPKRDGKALLDWALQQRLITGDSFTKAVEERALEQRWGIPRLRRYAALARSGARSEAERRLLRLLRRNRIGGWVANHAVRGRRGQRAELDVAWPSRRLCIEVDGRAHHSTDRAFERDRTRQNWLVRDGWKVLRVTWKQLTEQPREVIAEICDALDSRSPSSPKPQQVKSLTE